MHVSHHHRTTSWYYGIVRIVNHPLVIIICTVVYGTLTYLLGSAQGFTPFYEIGALCLGALLFIGLLVRWYLDRLPKEDFLLNVGTNLQIMTEISFEMIQQMAPTEYFCCVLMVPNTKYEWYAIHHMETLSTTRDQSAIPTAILPRGKCWMSYVDKRRGETRLVEIDEKMREELPDDSLRSIFSSNSYAIVAPIYRPGKEYGAKNVLGAFVVYSEEPRQSCVLYQKQATCLRKLTQASIKTASVLCYDCVCRI